jgi:DNA-binding NarL/FixJ family response regulator
MTNEIRVVIADDHPVFRQGLRQVLESERDLEVTAEVGDGEQALERIGQKPPHVVILDIDMPKMDGFAAARIIRAKRIPVEIVFLTMHKNEKLLNEAIDLGVKGFVLKDSAAAEIVACVRAVAAGQDFISPLLSSYLLNRRRRSERLTAANPTVEALTPAERRILRLIGDNKTSKEIAEELFISVRTVENHRANVAAKLNLRGHHTLLKFAIENKSALS